MWACLIQNVDLVVSHSASICPEMNSPLKSQSHYLSVMYCIECQVDDSLLLIVLTTVVLILPTEWLDWWIVPFLCHLCTVMSKTLAYIQAWSYTRCRQCLWPGSPQIDYTLRHTNACRPDKIMEGEKKENKSHMHCEVEILFDHGGCSRRAAHI